jgi:membrane-associated phospholipid phosphatase
VCLAGFGFPARNSKRLLLFDHIDRYFVRYSGLEHRVAVLLSEVGQPRTFVTITVVIALVLVLLGDYRAAATSVATVALSVFLVEKVLKPFFDHRFGDSATFPSGHTTVAFALAGAVALAARRDRPMGRRLPTPLRQMLVALVFVIAFAIGLAMVVLLFHFMSDVVAGIPLGLSVTGATALATDAVAARVQRSINVQPRPQPQRVVPQPTETVR